MITDEIRMVIEFAEAYKGPGWLACTVETFRYKDTGEILYSITMINRHRYDGPGECEDRLLISKEGDTFQARRVQMNRWPAQHYRKAKKAVPA